MDDGILHDVGEALYGPRWQTDLARVMGVSDRTMRRWVAGAAAVPSGIRRDLAHLCRQRGGALEALARRLEETEGS